ncbi:MAG: response regulator transcription factor [Anaerolineae bacterium]|nr:response regulator transcription factor [Anaerolineae bacterium]
MRILVIDDDPCTTELLTMILKPISTNILTAHSGREGVRMAKDCSPDVIVLDMMMPDLDGVQSCREIREFTSVPILIVSSAGQPNLIAEALNAGADDYLVKPVTRDILAATVNKFLRRRPHYTRPAIATV